MTDKGKPEEHKTVKDLRTMRKMLGAVMTDDDATSYDELVAEMKVPQEQGARLQENYPSSDFVLHQFMDFNRAELLRLKVRTAKAEASAS